VKIHSAEFVTSAASPQGFPPPLIPEVAFVGKSNVGKSSLINSLLNRKQLVKTSQTPGKTQFINFFLINGTFHLVDLPGYGFAKVPKSVRAGWDVLIGAYLMERGALRGVVSILDARHPPTPLDHHMVGLLKETGWPFLAVANKADKLKRMKLAQGLDTIRDDLGLPGHPLAYSAQTHQGRPELWRQLETWLGSRPPRPSSR